VVARRIRHTVIMAAGRGLRMMPATEDLPKAMMPYFESTLISNGIDRIRPHIDNIHVTVGYKAAMLAHHAIEHRVSSVHNTEGQSNSWWIFNTLLGTIDEPVFVLTCDNVTDLDFERLAEDYFELGEPTSLLVPVTPVPGIDGDYIFHDGPVVTELSRTRTAPTYASGIQVLNPARVRQLCSGEGDFGAVWSELIAQRQLFVSSVRPAKWFSVDTLEQLQLCLEQMGS
jgi:NDP-sugar pyrophosphorylase family protein